jgi:predicted secreted Zn-dependent protease
MMTNSKRFSFRNIAFPRFCCECFALSPTSIRFTILLLCMAVPGIGSAEVRDNLSYSYYDVNAYPDRPLRQQITAASPIWQDGKKYHGHTKWNVRWSFRWDTDRDGVCRITNVTTTLRTVITLPKLRSASERQSLVFDRYMIALRQHELGHYKIATDAARAIDDELRNLPATRNCAFLEGEGNAAARRTLNYFIEANRQYDVETDHGEAQGARLFD